MHGDTEVTVDADVLRQDCLGQSQLCVAVRVEKVFLTAHAADHDVGTGEICAAALVDAEERDLARPKRGIIVDNASVLGLR